VSATGAASRAMAANSPGRVRHSEPPKADRQSPGGPPIPVTLKLPVAIAGARTPYGYRSP
jgi:hypothetical protein